MNYLVTAYNDCPAENQADFWGTPTNSQYWIDKLSGSDSLRTQIVAGKSAEEIKAFRQSDIEKFKAQRKPYLLYGE